MSEELRDPPRLAASTDDALLRGALEAGKAELPSAAELAALAAKLGPIVGGGPAGPGGGSPAAGGAGGLGAATKLAAVVGLGAVVALGGAAYLGAFSPAAPTLGSANASANANASTNPTPNPNPNPNPNPTPNPNPNPTPNPNQNPNPNPNPNPTAHTNPRSAAAASAAASTAERPPEPLEPEATLLGRAQDALRSDPARALALCERHARDYPGALLGQEREVIAVDALTRLGRGAEAKARARRFREQNPSSSHLGRLKVLVGDDF
ncbi:MAG: hypothetical protein JNL38_19675 [Myxococcales bacterium]|nr:hypothetical protein [Myxococcales bacterium]